jgi:hypothetical protein
MTNFTMTAHISTLSAPDRPPYVPSPCKDKKKFVTTVVDKVCEHIGVSNVSVAHKAAIEKVTSEIAGAVLNGDPIKAVCEMPAGTGKSTLVAILIVTAHEYGHVFPSCICVDNLFAMESIHQRLLEAGIAPDDIACTFNLASLKGRAIKITPTPKESWANHRVLICCQTVVDGTRPDWPDRITSKWGTRFVFYDEELKRGQVRTFSLDHLKEQMDELWPYLSVTVNDWLKSVKEQLEDSTTSTHSIKPCPSITANAVRAAKKKWERVKGCKKTFPALDAVITEGITLIHRLAYGHVAIAKELPPLDRALILDASYSFCPYTKWDDDLSPIRTEPFKRYKHIKTIATGRSGSKTSIADREYEEKENLAALIESLKADGKRFLVICLLDFEATVLSAGATEVLTYGKHRGTNAYKDYDAVILFGLYYLSRVVTAGHLLLHRGDPDSVGIDIINWKQALVEAYQAANRTVMRNSYVDGDEITQAKQQTIYMFANLNKTQQKFWLDMLPDSQFATEGLDEQVKRVVDLLSASTNPREKKAEIRAKTGLRVIDGVTNRQWRKIAAMAVLRCGWIDEGSVWLERPTLTFPHK